MRLYPVAFTVLSLMVILPYSVAAAPPVLHVLAAERVGEFIVYAGYLSKGYMTIPVVGYLGESSSSYTVGPYGTMTRVRIVNSTTAVAVGSVWTTRGMAAVIVYLTPSRGEVNGYVVAAEEGSLYGDDVYVGDSYAVLAATIVKTSKGVNTSAVTWESDCVVARLSGQSVEGRVVGSVEYDDYPVIILRGERGYLLLGETWSHKVSQSAIFVARLDEELHLRGSYAYDSAAEDTVSDAALRGDTLYIGGYSGAEGGEALLIVERRGSWEAYTLAFPGGGYVDRLDGVSVSGTGRIGEKLTEYGYTYNVEEGRLRLYMVDDSAVTPLTPNGSLLLVGMSTIVSTSGVGFCAQPCNSTIRLDILDAPQLAGNLLNRSMDVRTVGSVFVEKGSVRLDIHPLRLAKASIPFMKAHVAVRKGVYKEKVDWKYRIMVFVNNNLALLVFAVPLLVAALLAWLAARRYRG